MTRSCHVLCSVTARLETLHAASLISDTQLFALEDLIGDYLAAKPEPRELAAAMVKVQSLVALSEGMRRDAALARQLIRQFCL